VVFRGGGSMQVSAWLPLPLDFVSPPALDRDGLDVEIQIENLPLVTGLSSTPGTRDVEGELSLEGKITGNLLDPVPELRLEIDEAALTQTLLRIRYEELDLVASWSGRDLQLTRFAAVSYPYRRIPVRKGRMEARGRARVSMDGIEAVQLQTDLDGFWLADTQEAMLSLSGELGLEGTWPDVRASGLVAVDEARFWVDEEVFRESQALALDDSIRVVRSGNPLFEESEVEEFFLPLDRIALDLDVSLERTLRLDAEIPLQDRYGQRMARLATVGVEAEVSGDLEVGGTVLDPRVHGELETSEGVVRVLGVGFDLDESLISFVGDDLENPILDLHADRTVGQYGDVRVDITGDVDEPVVAFTSEEYPDETDIVSLLLFNKPASHMSDTEGETSASLLSMALSSVSGQFERSLGTAYVDELEIDPGEGVRVGKALSDKLFLALELDPSADGGDNVTQATLEWLLRRQVQGEFVTGDRGQSSADIYWRWRF
ncbi:MAG: translocation/assembly module TamB domain-containing protein, partial [Myxococcota bacterium]|nr:translocation/assembly module TamB domain-containing protein [Myxococcota bacterium]